MGKRSQGWPRRCRGGGSNWGAVDGEEEERREAAARESSIAGTQAAESQAAC